MTGMIQKSTDVTVRISRYKLHTAWPLLRRITPQDFCIRTHLTDTNRILKTFTPFQFRFCCSVKTLTKSNLGIKNLFGSHVQGAGHRLRQVKSETQKLKIGIWRQGCLLYNVVFPKPRNSFCQEVQESHCGCFFLAYLLDHPLLAFYTTQKFGLGPSMSVINKDNPLPHAHT